MGITFVISVGPIGILILVDLEEMHRLDLLCQVNISNNLGSCCANVWLYILLMLVIGFYAILAIPIWLAGCLLTVVIVIIVSIIYGAVNFLI